jgi:DNA-binding transcriptional ArsR family regulator
VADVAQVLVALAEPTRRLVLDELRAGPRSVGEITDAVPVSQSAVSQHLRVLREAGLVRERREGTRRLYRVEPDGLGALRAYLDEFWDDALESFRRLADEEGRP